MQQGHQPSLQILMRLQQDDDKEDGDDDDQSYCAITVDGKQTAQLMMGMAVTVMTTASVNKKKQKKNKKDATVSLQTNYESLSVLFVSHDELCQETIVALATMASMVAMSGLGVQPALGLSFGAVVTFAAFLDGPVGAFV